MSDYCPTCAFNPKTECPISNLYWAFLDRHKETLAGNHRMRLVLSSLAKRERSKRDEDKTVFEWVSQTLNDGKRLRLTDRPEGA